MKRMIVCVVSALIVLLVVVSTVFSVNAGHMAIVSSPNRATLALAGPGVYLKLPPPFQVVTPVDVRVRTFNLPETVRCATADKASLLIMPVIYYRVAQPLKLFAATKGAPGKLPDQLAPLAQAALTAAVSRHTFSDVLSRQPDTARAVRDALKVSAAPLGIEVREVQFTRVAYPDMGAVSAQQAARQAQQEQQEQQTKANSSSAGAAPLTALQQARKMRDDADAQAVEIVAQAGARDPKFYQFWQRMQTYRTGFRPGDVMVVDVSNANAGGAPADNSPHGAKTRHR